MPVKKLKIASGYKGSSVTVKKGSRMFRVNLDDATQSQLKILYDLGHPSVVPDTKSKSSK